MLWKGRKIARISCCLAATASLALLGSSCRFDKKTASIVFPVEQGRSAKIFRCEAGVARSIGSGGGGGDSTPSGIRLKWSAPSLPVLDLDGDGVVTEIDALRAVAHLLDEFIQAQFGEMASRAEISYVSVEELPEPYKGGSRGVSLESLQTMGELFKNNIAGSVVELIPSTGEAWNIVTFEAKVKNRIFFAKTGVAEGLVEFGPIKGEALGGGETDQVLINGLYARLGDFSALLGDRVVEFSDMVLTVSEPILLKAVSQTNTNTKRSAIWRLSGPVRGIFLSWKADGVLYGRYVELEEQFLDVQINFMAGAAEMANPAFQLGMELPISLMGIPGKKGGIQIRAQGRWINRAPMAWAGNGIGLEVGTPEGMALVELNGSGTVDYDEEPSFMWIEDYNVGGRERLISTQKVARDVELGMGQHTITLLTKDSFGAVSLHTTSIRVQSAPPRVRLSVNPDLVYVPPEEEGIMTPITPRCSFRPTALPVTSLRARVCAQLPPKKKFGGFDIQLNGDPIYGLCGETALDPREPQFDLQVRERLTGSKRKPGLFRYTVEVIAQDTQGTVGRASDLVLMSPPIQE